MWPLTFVRIAVAGCIALAMGGLASACKCSSGFHGKNRWDLAKEEEKGSAVIFEGMPERFDLEWNLLSAKVGELIPAENPAAQPDKWPRMFVTFQVIKLYKGTSEPKIQVSTGLGGGGCGALFAPGVSYLVLAVRGTDGNLGVSMCSPGGWTGSKEVATELRYLRRERPVADDLVMVRPLTVQEYAAQQGGRQHDFEESQKMYAAVTGKICGKVVRQNARTKDAAQGTLSFLSLAGYSPVAHPTVGLNPDGSFCSKSLGPGKYLLFFTRYSKDGLTSAVYYPGVTEKNVATAVEVSAGQTVSGIIFKVPSQTTYSVQGIISTNDKSGMDARIVSVALVGLDGVPFPVAYSKPVDFESSLPLPKVKYFHFGDVLPGRYIASVSVFGDGWYTEKQEVVVTSHEVHLSQISPQELARGLLGVGCAW